ncbi:MAG: NAD(+) synthase [Proteobacteria bacterium]|nr:NAD(+) synthase [Pseudomonadota bacterium]
MIPNIDILLDYLYEEIRKQTDTAVVGLSGGADSSLTAILCAKALGRENVYGISMPFDQVDIQTFNARSAVLAEKIGINHQVRPIAKIAEAINDQIFIDEKNEVTTMNAGNSRSRARMCVLYGLAHNITGRFPEKRVRVAGTGNLSEDFIGYDTKGGDALADFFPIGELFKSEVYQVLEHFRDEGTITEDNIDRIPSAGLEEDQTDEKDLGYSYNEMEKGVRFCLDNYEHMSEQTPDEIAAFVWQRHLSQKHKHEAPPVIKLRQLCD